MKLSARFIENQNFFIGREVGGKHTHMLFDCIEFREYIDDFFDCGTSFFNKRKGNQWMFYSDNNALFNSNASGVQNDFYIGNDGLSVLYSLRYQVMTSEHSTQYMCNTPLEQVNGSLKRRLRNWYLLYRMLAVLFHDELFVEYCEKFPKWRHFGNWVRDNHYYTKAIQNMNELLRAIRD